MYSISHGSQSIQQKSKPLYDENTIKDSEHVAYMIQVE